MQLHSYHATSPANSRSCYTVLLQYMTWPATGRYINRELVKRAHSLPKWLIVLKCCITHHRLLRESKGQYAKHLTDAGAYAADSFQRDPSLSMSAAGSQAYPPGPRPTAGFPPGPGAGVTGSFGAPGLPTPPHMVNDAAPPLGLSTFRDGSCKKAFDLSTFIRMYSTYLDVLLDVYARVKYLPVGNVEAPKFKCAPAPHSPHSHPGHTTPGRYITWEARGQQHRVDSISQPPLPPITDGSTYFMRSCVEVGFRGLLCRGRSQSGVLSHTSVPAHPLSLHVAPGSVPLPRQQNHRQGRAAVAVL